MSFGARLREARLRRHLTQEALAEALGLASKTISRWEQDLAIPRSFARQQLARFFDLSPEELFEDLGLDVPLARLWTVPFPRHPFFTGREEILCTLATRLTIEQTIAQTQASALWGLGGIGKTQVAVEYAYRSASQYRAVFWLEAETQESLMRSLCHIAEQLQLPEREAAEQAQMVGAVKRWLAAHPGWLLIADNVEELDLLQMVLPPMREGALLITTRRQALGPLAEPLEVPPLSEEESVTLLLRRSRQFEASTPGTAHPEKTGFPSAVAAATELAKLLEGLPLALDQAGAYLEETGCSLVEYLSLYQSHQRKHVLAHRGLHGGAHPDSVSTTLSLSVQRIAKTHPAAEDLLHLCAFLHPEAIAEEMLVAGASHLGPRLGAVVADPYQLHLVLAALRSASLVTRSPATHTLAVHRLVQAVLADQMEPASVCLWSQRVIRMVNAAFPNGQSGNWGYEPFGVWIQCERLLAQVLACLPLIESAGSNLPESGEILFKAGGYLLARGRYREAEPLVEQAVTLAERQQGLDPTVLIARLQQRAQLLWRQGKYTDAEALLERVLLLREQQLGPTYLKTADTLNYLGLVYYTLGKYEAAEPLYRQALDICEQQLGSTHLRTADTLINLGLLYYTLGKYEAAESLWIQVLRIQEQQLGPEHPILAIILNNFATMYRDQGKYEQAEPLFQRAIDIREQQLGPENPQTAYTQSNLATMYRDQGKYEQAEHLYQRVLRMQELQLGGEHPHIAETLEGLAILYQRQKKFGEAERLFLQALRMRERLLGPTHLEVAQTLSGLANGYRDQGQYEQAEPLYQRALAIIEQQLGTTHPNTIKIRDDWLCCKKSGRMFWQ
ncbi:tetratricopeptide repeat protein [Reticulibacter mediterranei]|uniref:Tetratricopeptide repeat protein n=1 Tax=Reticulibacter mediterranei TaxID=2778369 RepID=A0A8J3J4I6_9CHLR|nr:FxSxx-COOH system tetratricopeptide repeat protein [Reticulibacter mediterranei]GHP00567.1 tetratricopeptide repeat protein [Reticulibacter mediterranei]